MTEHYEINEKDIEVTLRYLKYHDPENATREVAITMLQDLKSGFHSMAHNHPDVLLGLQKELDESRESKNSTN